MFTLSRFVVRQRALFMAILILTSLWFISNNVLADSEKELIEKIQIKIKLQKYEEASVLLKESQEKYSSSVKLAELAVILREKLATNREELVNAYRRLIEVIQWKEVNEGKLSPEESKLLKETQKKLEELIKTTRTIDATIEEFVSVSTNICRDLISVKKYPEASFVFHRLCIVGLEEEEKGKLLEELGQENSEIVKEHNGSFSSELEKAKKFILDAQESLKKNSLDEAMIACQAGLEIEPNLAIAYAILCEIAERMKKKDTMLISGLTYFLFPLEVQSFERAEKIEICIRKASPELNKFFNETTKAAEKICNLAKKAFQEKKNLDLEYALQRLSSLTHRTKKVEAVILNLPLPARVSPKLSRGIKIFNGNDLSDWNGTGRVSNGCIVIDGAGGQMGWLDFEKISTEESFNLQCSCQIIEQDTKAEVSQIRPSIVIGLWDGRKIGGYLPAFLFITLAEGWPSVVVLSRQGSTGGWQNLITEKITTPIFEIGKWYEINVTYEHVENKITIMVNGQKAATIIVPKDVSPERKGYIGVGQQDYKCVSFKEIYLEQ